MKQKRDKFEISEGNLLVLKLIPMMMKDKHYRRRLRDLAMGFWIHLRGEEKKA